MATEAQQKFIDTVAPLSREMVKFRPKLWASVSIAQAILESGWGKSDLSKHFNNIYGVKWFGDPNGPFPEYVQGAAKLPTIERPDLGGQRIEAYFRTYASYRDSVFDQAEVLLKVKAYADTGAFNETTPEGFIRKIGPVYTGGDSTYAEKIINIINQFGLKKYDTGKSLDALKYVGNVTKDTMSKALEVLEAVQNAGYPINIIYGYNPDSKPEHSSGRALDFMCSREAGDWIADYLWKHRARLRVRWIIWWQRIRSTTPGKSGQWEPMADRGSVTQNHKDHVHAFFDDGYSVPPLPVVDEGAWIAERLKYHGFDRNSDRTVNLKEFQRVRLGRPNPDGALDIATRTSLNGARFVSSMKHSTQYFTPIDVRIMRFAQLKLGVALPVVSKSEEMWAGNFQQQWSQAAYLLGFMNWQAERGLELKFPMTFEYWQQFAKESGVFDPVE